MRTEIFGAAGSMCTHGAAQVCKCESEYVWATLSLVAAHFIFISCCLYYHWFGLFRTCWLLSCCWGMAQEFTLYFFFFFISSVPGWFSLCLLGAHCIDFFFFFFFLTEKSESGSRSTCKRYLPPRSTVRGNRATRRYFLILCGLTGAWAQTEVLFQWLALKSLLLVWKVNQTAQFRVTNGSRDFLTKPSTSNTQCFRGRGGGSVCRTQWFAFVCLLSFSTPLVQIILTFRMEYFGPSWEIESTIPYASHRGRILTS